MPTSSPSEAILSYVKQQTELAGGPFNESYPVVKEDIVEALTPDPHSASDVRAAMGRLVQQRRLKELGIGADAVGLP